MGSHYCDRGKEKKILLWQNPAKDILDQLKKLLKKAGLPDMRFHDLRHRIASILFSMGTHPKIVQELLGHNRIQETVDTYSHMLPTMQQETIKRLEDTMWQ